MATTTDIKMVGANNKTGDNITQDNNNNVNINSKLISATTQTQSTVSDSHKQTSTKINLPSEVFCVVGGQQKQQHQMNGNNSINSANNDNDTSSSSVADSSMAKFSNPPWWHRRTRLERYLCIVVMFTLILLSLGLGSFLAFIGPAPSTHGFNAKVEITEIDMITITNIGRGLILVALATCAITPSSQTNSQFKSPKSNQVIEYDELTNQVNPNPQLTKIDNQQQLKPKTVKTIGRPTALNWINYDQNSGIDYYRASPQNHHQHSPPQSGHVLTGNALAESAGGPLASVLGITTNSNQIQDNNLQQHHPMGGPRNRLAKQAPLINEPQYIGNTISDSAMMLADETGGKVCMTETCVKSAAEILRNMDQRVEPCDDFYRYSCGGWIDSQVIPEDKTSVSLFTSVQDELDNKLRQLIEKKEPPPNDPPIVGKMRRLYESCMNTTLIEELGDEPLLAVLKQFGGWPVLGAKSGWSEESLAKFDWLDLLIKFRKLGFSHDVLIDLSVTPDFQNNTRHIIDLDQVLLGMPDRSYLLKGINDSSVAAYYRMMVESAVFLGADKQEAESQMLKVLNFETQLANFSLAREERRNISSLYNKMTIAQLSEVAPNINWNKFLTNLLDQPLRADEEMIVNVPTYFNKLDKLLIEVDKKTLANYLIWRVVMQSISTLGKRWRELAQTYSSVITGQEREEARWEQCLSSLTGTLGIAISSMYVKNHFKSDSKGLALEMVDYIRREFKNILESVDWMDENTKDEAKAKADAISAHIGYPDELLNDTLVETLYSGLEMDKRKYFDNILHLRRWSVDFSFNQLRKPNLKVDWRKHARTATVNAFYNSLDNSIEFPAGILQGSFFDRDRPNYLNFGAIGFIIGHEITHGFDDKGRQFDKDGNNRNWWNQQTDERFKERAQCIIDQYGNYTVPENGLKLNGINTQGENIADNGGLKEAFRAYNEWTRRNGDEPKLPGIKLNPRQLFWVSAANVWCAKHRPEALKMRVMVGSHSPSQFRVTGPLSNLKEFSETFNCPVGSALNPVQKCSVW